MAVQFYGNTKITELLKRERVCMSQGGLIVHNMKMKNKK